jgi:hypothetical protein
VNSTQEPVVYPAAASCSSIRPGPDSAAGRSGRP